MCECGCVCLCVHVCVPSTGGNCVCGAGSQSTSSFQGFGLGTGQKEQLADGQRDRQRQTERQEGRQAGRQTRAAERSCSFPACSAVLSCALLCCVLCLQSLEQQGRRGSGLASLEGPDAALHAEQSRLPHHRFSPNLPKVQDATLICQACQDPRASSKFGGRTAANGPWWRARLGDG